MLMFLEIWLISSIFIGIVVFTFVGVKYPSWEIILLYPAIVKLLDAKGINIAGKITMCTLISIIFAPFLLLYFTVVFTVTIILFLSFCFMDLFDLLFKKR